MLSSLCSPTYLFKLSFRHHVSNPMPATELRDYRIDLRSLVLDWNSPTTWIFQWRRESNG